MKFKLTEDQIMDEFDKWIWKLYKLEDVRFTPVNEQENIEKTNYIYKTLYFHLKKVAIRHNYEKEESE